MPINKRESTELNHLNIYILKLLLNTLMIWMIFIKILNNTIQKKESGKILTVFDDMIADMLNNKKRNLVVTELFIKGKKINVFFVFIMQTCFAVKTKLD